MTGIDSSRTQVSADPSATVLLRDAAHPVRELEEAVDVISWDGPLLICPARLAEQLTPPLTLTKRGCLVIAVRNN